MKLWNPTALPPSPRSQLHGLSGTKVPSKSPKHMDKALLNGVIPDRKQGERLSLAVGVRQTGMNPTWWSVDFFDF